MAIRKIQIEKIEHTPAVGGVFDFYKSCIGADIWELVKENVTVNPDGTLAEIVEFEYDDTVCEYGVDVQVVTSCENRFSASAPLAEITTTTTSTTTTTTFACPNIVQIFGQGFSGTP